MVAPEFSTGGATPQGLTEMQDKQFRQFLPRVQRLAAFSSGNRGGNPAGVLLCDELPDSVVMQAVATEIGYSETVFSAPRDGAWVTRYFTPEAPIPFCGHATIALGAALAMANGDGRFNLSLTNGEISVESRRDGELMWAALQSLPTRSKPADGDIVATALALFGYSEADLDPRIPPAIAEAGAIHLILALSSREHLARMNYELEAGRRVMKSRELVTINLIYAEGPQMLHSRNLFASGGVMEDAATGAAAAALAGYLRDLRWPHGGHIRISQGEDMGMISQLEASFTDKAGSSVRVAGTARQIV